MADNRNRKRPMQVKFLVDEKALGIAIQKGRSQYNFSLFQHIQNTALTGNRHMLTVLFVFALISIASFVFTREGGEDSFERSYRSILDRFWHVATGAPIYRKCFWG